MLVCATGDRYEGGWKHDARDGRGTFVRADGREDAEHDRIWAALVEDRPNYREYLENSVREKLPLIRLVED